MSQLKGCQEAMSCSGLESLGCMSLESRFDPEGPAGLRVVPTLGWLLLIVSLLYVWHL
jgi:hypothetical protein